MSAKKTQIIAAAMDAFLQNGFAVSMDHVAERAVVSKQTIYTHFKSKEALFTAIIQERVGAFRLPSEDFNTELSLDNFLVSFAEKYLVHCLSKDSINIFKLIVGEAEKIPTVASIYFKEVLESPTSILQGFFEKQNKIGNLHFPDPRLAAEQFCGMVSQHVFTKALFMPFDLDEEERRTIAKEATKVFLHGHNKLKFWMN